MVVLLLCPGSIVVVSTGDAERLRLPMVNEGGGGDEGEFKRSARVDIVRESKEQAPPSERKVSKKWGGFLISETLR